MSAFPFVYGVLSFWKNRQVIQSLQFLLVYKILRFYLLNFKYTAKLPSNLQFLLIYRILRFYFLNLTYPNSKLASGGTGKLSSSV